MQTHHVFGDFVAVVAGTIKSLAWEAQANRSVDTRALLLYHTGVASESAGLFDHGLGREAITYGVKSLYIFDTVVLVRLGRISLVHFLNSLVAILLQVGSVGKISNDPGKGVSKVDSSSDYSTMVC